jgi:hypothetical protein
MMKMGYSLRYFIAEDDGALTRVPTAKYHRWFFDGEALPPARAGRELRLLEVVVDVDRHSVMDVLRILPVRHLVRENGRLDASASMRLALKRLIILERVYAGDPWAQIAQLEVDANYFWLPTDVQLKALGTALLKRPPSPAQFVELRAVVFRPGDALRDR